MDKTTTLKPCPFCGRANPELRKTASGENWHIVCDDCGGQSGVCGTAAPVVGWWNTRPDERALLETLKKVLATGLNGGNNLRLAYIAASHDVLSQDLLDKAEASEQAVNEARALIAAAS